MTTLDEIRRCPVANHQFWSDSARSSLAFYRYAGTCKQDRALERRAFRKAMSHRRAQTYLDVQVGQMSLFKEAA